MRQSGAENSLVYEWLALLRRHYRLYNVDNQHRCRRLATYREHQLSAEELELQRRKRRRRASEPLRPIDGGGGDESCSIVQPFVWAPHFYGCVECGRYHFCRRDERECELVYNEHADEPVTCLHSGQVLREALSYETETHSCYDEEQRFKQDAVRHDEESVLSSGRSRYTFGASRTPYSNSRTRQPLCTQEQLEELERCEAREDMRRDCKKRQRRSEEEAVESMQLADDAAEEVEAHIAEQSNQARLKNRHDNRLYWNTYFGFLLEPSNSGVSEQQLVEPHTRATVTTPALYAPYQPTYQPLGLSAEACAVVEQCAYEVVTRLMKAQHRALQRKQPRDIDALNRRLVAHWLPVLCNVLALAQHQQRRWQESALRTSCIALLLFGLTESFWDTDAEGARIEVWHGEPWLAALQRDGIIEQLFAPRRSKLARTKKRSVTHYDRVQVKQAHSQLEQLLSHYRGHALWLRRYVLNGPE